LEVRSQRLGVRDREEEIRIWEPEVTVGVRVRDKVVSKPNQTDT
jgi:hypothetical protein